MNSHSDRWLFLILVACLGSVFSFSTAEAVQWYPRSNLVSPPLSDPRTPRNYMRVFVVENEDEGKELLGGEAGLTQRFGIARWNGDKFRYQLSMEGGVFSMFQESPDDYELVSSDYHIGFPLEISNGPHGGRIELFHVSSHLGDEFSERTGRPRISFSHESIRGTYFWEYSPSGRAFVGGEYALNITPEEGILCFWVDSHISGENGFWVLILEPWKEITGIHRSWFRPAVILAAMLSPSVCSFLTGHFRWASSTMKKEPPSVLL